MPPSGRTALERSQETFLFYFCKCRALIEYFSEDWLNVFALRREVVGLTVWMFEEERAEHTAARNWRVIQKKKIKKQSKILFPGRTRYVFKIQNETKWPVESGYRWGLILKNED